MPEVDPNSIPFVPPTEVTMVTKEGKQTTALHDWFTGLWSWMKNSVVDLTTKITTLTASVGDLSASIIEESTIRETEDGILASRITTVEATSSANSAAITSEASARVSGDSALASQITTVEAKANSATASGQIYFAAKAGPSGSVAAYGMYLTAGSAYAGLEALALSGGGSAIGFTANQFRFVDSGTAQQVLSYSSGVFTFEVPIQIRTGTSGARMVLTNENIRVYDASNYQRVALGVNI